MVSTSQFKNGLTIKYDGKIYTIVEFQHIKPGKGGAFVRTKLRDLRTKAILDRTFDSGEKFEEAFIEEKKVQFLYKDSNVHHFMDIETYEQIAYSQEQLGDCVNYLKENLEVALRLFEGQLIEIILPTFVEMKVTQAPPGVKGDTARSASKEVILETGLVIQAPLFINEGDLIKVDTRTGQYAARA
jgi:elongation factor P